MPTDRLLWHNPASLDSGETVNNSHQIVSCTYVPCLQTRNVCREHSSHFRAGSQTYACNMHPSVNKYKPIAARAHAQVFGASQLILSQLPDISSLREINLVCTFCTICFAAGCLALSIYNGELPTSLKCSYTAKFSNTITGASC